MQNAETVLGVLRERGTRGLPCDELYRQLFNPQLYLLAYGRIYANKGAMTPGVTQETVDGMSLGRIDRIIDAMRHERYRFRPVRRAGRKPLVAQFGGIPLKRDKNAVLTDRVPTGPTYPQKELINRLLQGRCELCRATDEISVHHVRSLTELAGTGQPQPV